MHLEFPGTGAPFVLLYCLWMDFLECGLAQGTFNVSQHATVQLRVAGAATKQLLLAFSSAGGGEGRRVLSPPPWQVEALNIDGLFFLKLLLCEARSLTGSSSDCS